MVPSLKQFVPSSTCLSCDGCCRYKEKESSWRPKMMEEEKGKARSSGLAEKILAKHFDPQGFITTVPCNGIHFCQFLKPEDNTCRIYAGRPFECQLYPFVLTKQEDALEICVHGNCPYVQDHRQDPEFQAYVSYLQEFFQRPEVRDFLKRNPALIGDYAGYREELESLFLIH